MVLPNHPEFYQRCDLVNLPRSLCPCPLPFKCKLLIRPIQNFTADDLRPSSTYLQETLAQTFAPLCLIVPQLYSHFPLTRFIRYFSRKTNESEYLLKTKFQRKTRENQRNAYTDKTRQAFTPTFSQRYENLSKYRQITVKAQNCKNLLKFN